MYLKPSIKLLSFSLHQQKFFKSPEYFDTYSPVTSLQKPLGLSSPLPLGYHQTPPPPLQGIGVWIILLVNLSALVSWSPVALVLVTLYPPPLRLPPPTPRVWNIVYLALSVYKHQSSGLWGLEALVLVPVAQLWVGHHPCRVAIQVGIVSVEKQN